MITPGLKILQKYGSMECPIKPNVLLIYFCENIFFFIFTLSYFQKIYAWKSVESMTDNFPSLVPTGRYMAELKLFSNKIEFFNYIGVGDIKHKLLVDW